MKTHLSKVIFRQLSNIIIAAEQDAGFYIEKQGVPVNQQ